MANYPAACVDGWGALGRGFGRVSLAGKCHKTVSYGWVFYDWFLGGIPSRK